jgi:Receptor L domain
MNKQCIWLVCALSTACSAGFGKASVSTPERVSCPGGVIQTQAELGRYAGCTQIDGDLLVEHVDSLAPLAALEAVAGKLRIEHTRHLYSLAGLENLERVRELSLEDNTGLIDGGALHGLLHAERAHIAKNPRLSRAHGFEQGLVQSGASLELTHNAGLYAEGMREFRSQAAGITVAQR